jgi:hypothetical protein
VPGPFEQTNYSSLKIHYQFHASQNDPKSDPVASWHQGGPGSDSIAVGLYTEMGYFQVDSNGTYVNEHAWNNVASMLYLESPAGSGGSSGFSECIVADKPVDCYWNDTSQAEAYAHSLTAFFDAFPEYKSNEFYLTVRSAGAATRTRSHPQLLCADVARSLMSRPWRSPHALRHPLMHNRCVLLCVSTAGRVIRGAIRSQHRPLYPQQRPLQHQDQPERFCDRQRLLVKKRRHFSAPFLYIKKDHLTKTGSGQT